MGIHLQKLRKLQVDLNGFKFRYKQIKFFVLETKFQAAPENGVQILSSTAQKVDTFIERKSSKVRKSFWKKGACKVDRLSEILEIHQPSCL